MLKNQATQLQRHPILSRADFTPVESSMLEAVPPDMIGSSITNHLAGGVYDHGLAPFIKADVLLNRDAPAQMAVNRFLSVPPDFSALSPYESSRRKALDVMFGVIKVLEKNKQEAEAYMSPMGEYALESQHYNRKASRSLHHAEVIRNYLVSTPNIEAIKSWRNIYSKEQRNMHLRQRLPHESDGRIGMMLHYLMSELKRDFSVPVTLRAGFDDVAKALNHVKIMLHYFDVMADKGLVGNQAKPKIVHDNIYSDVDIAHDNTVALFAEIVESRLFDFEQERALVESLLLTHPLAQPGHLIDEVVDVKEVLERAGRFLAFADTHQGSTLLDDRDQFRLEYRTINYLEIIAQKQIEFIPVIEALEKIAIQSDISAIKAGNGLTGNDSRIQTEEEALQIIKLATKSDQNLYNILYQMGGEEAVTPYLDLLEQVRQVRRNYHKGEGYQGARLDRVTARKAVRLMDSIANEFKDHGEEFQLYRRAGTALNKLHTPGSFERGRLQRRMVAQQSIKPLPRWSFAK